MGQRDLAIPRCSMLLPRRFEREHSSRLVSPRFPSGEHVSRTSHVLFPWFQWLKKNFILHNVIFYLFKYDTWKVANHLVLVSFQGPNGTMKFYVRDKVISCESLPKLDHISRYVLCFSLLIRMQINILSSSQLDKQYVYNIRRCKSAIT